MSWFSDWWNNQITATSQTQFVELAKNAGAKMVYVNNVRAKTAGFDMLSMALDEGSYGYFIELIAPTRKRTIVFTEKLAELVRQPMLDGKARGEQAVKLLLVVEKRRNELRELLPGANVIVGQPKDGERERLSPDDWERLHRDARQHGITV